MLTEIPPRRVGTGAVIIQLVIVVPQLNPIGVGAVHISGDFSVGGSQAFDRSIGEILLASLERPATGELFQSGPCNQSREHQFSHIEF